MIYVFPSKFHVKHDLYNENNCKYLLKIYNPYPSKRLLKTSFDPLPPLKVAHCYDIWIKMCHCGSIFHPRLAINHRQVPILTLHNAVLNAFSPCNAPLSSGTQVKTLRPPRTLGILLTAPTKMLTNIFAENYPFRMRIRLFFLENTNS